MYIECQLQISKVEKDVFCILSFPILPPKITLDTASTQKQQKHSEKFLLLKIATFATGTEGG